MAKRKPTKYPGIYERQVKKRFGDGKEAAYGGRVKRDGKAKDVTFGRASEGMTPAKAAKLKAQMQAGIIPLPQEKKAAEKAAAEKAAREAAQARPNRSLADIWALYQKEMGSYGGQQSDRTHWERRVKATFGHKAPQDITAEAYIIWKDALREMRTVARGPETMLAAGLKWKDEAKIKEAKKRILAQSKPISEQVQIHAMALLRKLCIWANKTLKEPMPDIVWNIPKAKKKPREKLTPEAIANLVDVCWHHPHPCAGKMILLALFTGARKTEILQLRWDGIDYEKKTITLGVNPKTGTTKPGESEDKIPLNSGAKMVLESIAKHRKNPWVFPSPITGRPYVTVAEKLRDVIDAAGLPKSFRPMHGNRHVFGTAAASLGGLMATKELLRHKDIESSETYVELDMNHWGQISEMALATLLQKVGQAPTDGPGADVIDIAQKRPA